MNHRTSRLLTLCGCVLLLTGTAHAQVRRQQEPQQQQPRQGGLQNRGVPVNQAPWGNLSPAHEKYLDQILQYWEHRTARVERYRCQFQRWEWEQARHVDEQGKVTYKPTNTTYSKGAIKYAAPDKGLFQVEQIKHRSAPKEPGAKPQWVEQQDGHREHWVCDGKSIFEFNYPKKQLVQKPLPKEMQGQQITDGPLPFLFGAKADKIKQRFWVRVITPKDAKGEYWLEAVPKTREDAQNFNLMHIIIDEKEFLPKGMVLFHSNSAKTTFSFDDRETNWSILVSQLSPWIRQFFEPAVPRGWKKVVQPVPGLAGGNPQGPAQQAQQPRQGGDVR